MKGKRQRVELLKRKLRKRKLRKRKNKAFNRYKAKRIEKSSTCG